MKEQIKGRYRDSSALLQNDNQGGLCALRDVDQGGVGAPHFVRGMGLFSATAIVMGSMIGSGIFIVSADMGRTLGSPALLIGAWLVTAAMTLIGALSYGELAAMMPKAGGQYVYLRESLGPIWGFLYGWTLFLVIQTGHGGGGGGGVWEVPWGVLSEHQPRQLDRAFWYAGMWD